MKKQMAFRRVLFVVQMMVLVLTFAGQPVYAADPDNFKNQDLEAMAFPNNKKGCGKRAAMHVAVANMYKQGKPAGEILKFKIAEEMIQKMYDRIKESGLTQANLDNIKSYKDCIAGSEPVKDEEKELELASVHKSCTALADVVLGTLESIQSRRKEDTAVELYASQKLDLMDTPFEEFGVKDNEYVQSEVAGNPAEGIVRRLYAVAGKTSYDDAVEHGNMIVVGCFMAR